MRYFCDHDRPGIKRSISLSRVSRWCNNFLLAWSRVCPHAFHMVWGALHFRVITHVVIPLSSLYASCRSHVGLLLLSPSSRAITHWEAYFNLESAQESRKLFKVLNMCWVPLAVRICFGQCSCLLSWRKPVGPSSALANSLGLMSPFQDHTHFVVDRSY